MGDTNSVVKRLTQVVSAGFSLSEAIRAEFKKPVKHWAEERGFSHSAVSMCINRRPGRVYPEIREALADDLGVSTGDVAYLIELSAQSRE